MHFLRGLVFAVFFPLLQVSAFFIGVGGEPKGLKIGIVNDEAGNCDYGNDIGNIWYNEVNDIPECNWSNLSCRFIHNYKDTILEQVSYNTCHVIVYVYVSAQRTFLLNNASLFARIYFTFI